ncbi:MATE family efflux transporter [Crenobacter sp. SG2305]|uniref:MATE family efflux transporter n=1 Tax=Crenobacter oryzisoli TaxID=3056844 RepID=UPI0025AA79DA|nr:MATE family efflux transporter [Crenobacter sp. SG2305]MDN0083644.1 MATE family efflux transporter [Crenobacter sp. SG2305]
MEDSRAIMALAIPLVLSQFAQTGILFIDTLLMGRLGPASLAGGALALSAYYFCYILVFGAVSASSNLVALAHGAGRRREVVAAVRAGILLSVLLSLLIGMGLWHAKPVMLALGQPADIADVAQGFLRLLVWGMPFSLLFMALRGFASGIGKPGPVPFITFSALALSATLGWVLSHWIGVYGIALASACTYLYMGLSFSWVVTRHRVFRRYPIFAGFDRRDLAIVRPLLKIGIPTAGTLGLESSLFNACAWLMGALGAVQLAAHQSMMQLVIASFMVPLGLMYAVSMRVGQAAGAGEWERVRRSALVGQGMALVWTLLTATTLFLAPDALIALFLPDGRANVVEARAVAMSLVPLAALLCLFDGWQSLTGAVLRALKDARITMVIYAVGCWGVGLPLSWWLSRHGLGPAGVWWGMCSGLLVVCLLLYWRFEHTTRRLILLRPKL